MFRIGCFSKLSGLSIDTLYHYEKMKLLTPAHIDAASGYRFYEAGQLVTVNQILALKDAGFSLEEIASILNSGPSMPSLLKLLEEKAQSLDVALKVELNRLERLHTNIFLIKNGGIPIMNEITIKRVEPILIASIRKAFHKNKFHEALGTMWNEVNGYIAEKGGKRTIPCLMLYHTGWWDTAEDGRLDVEVAEPITAVLPNNNAVRVYELPAVDRMVCIVHKGPFATIGATTDAMFQWTRQNGYTLAGPVREIYHKGDWATDDPNEYITELQVPIQ